jgi:hypothetical protein
MKIIEVRKVTFENDNPTMDEISDRLDKLGKGHSIDIINWKEYNYKPEVRFNIAYRGKEIFLKYYIKENYFKSEKTETNQMVCEDSCVEFFVSPADDGIYYNFEFNGIGTCLSGTGTCREDSALASPAMISGIRRLTSAGNLPVKEKRGEFLWTITLAFPGEVFFRHEIKELRGKIFRANFYKCGDKLSKPHYLTWNPIDTAAPDYHQPGYFGQLKFV